MNIFILTARQIFHNDGNNFLWWLSAILQIKTMKLATHHKLIQLAADIVFGIGGQGRQFGMLWMTSVWCVRCIVDFTLSKIEMHFKDRG